MRLRILSRAQVIAAGGDDFGAAMADIRQALLSLREGNAEMPAETSVRLGNSEATQSRAYALPARVGDRAGVKWTAHAFHDNRDPDNENPSVMSITAINDAIGGQSIGIVESALLTATRTAAATAFMLQARPPRRLALLGAGLQARTHLRMLAELFPALERVTLWNRSQARAAELANAAATPFPCAAVADLDRALDAADTVLTCTNADSPLLGADAMQPGRSVLQIGYHEVAFAAIARADAVVVDLWGEFRLTSAKSLFQMHRAGQFDAGRVTADLAALALDGWRPAPNDAVYFSSFGLNLFDVALAARVLRVAEARGIGDVRDMLN